MVSMKDELAKLLKETPMINSVCDLDKNFVERANYLIEKGVCIRKQGEWKYSPQENIAICSICGEEHYLGTYHQFATNFCPNCGSKMSNSKS